MPIPHQRFNPHKIKRKKFYPGKQSSIELVKAINSIKTLKQDKEKVEEVYTPTNGFADFPLHPQLLSNIVYKGYKEPTPIQDKAIPPIIAGRDVIGIANTGTGKTAAFLIPLINKIVNDKTQKVLIIAPTRELALQIYDELRSMIKGLGIHTAVCIGGMSMGRQRIDLNQRPHFVVGTPGRLKDLIEEKHLFPSHYHTVVLDEADRMVDIGFIHDIKYFISLLPTDRQSLFFSATVSGKVKEILDGFVHNPVTVSVEKQETTDNIHQDIVHVINKHKKIEQLHDLLIQKGFDKVLIFGRTKWGVQKLADQLADRGFKVGAIHGNKRQNQRQKVLDQFKNGEITILLATDVASRGLDIPDVTHVINYEMPETKEDYIHRIGRTGRAQKKGVALTFID